MRNRLQVKIWKSSTLPTNCFKRTQTLDEAVGNDVKAIVSKVAKNGNAALIEFTEKFDKTRLKAESLQVTKEEIKEAYSLVSEEQISALKLIKSKVSSFEKLILDRFKIKTSKDGIAIQNVLG